jgi:ABC-type Fe3+/spermidine/putrescine transport system ATPase subunit
MTASMELNGVTKRFGSRVVLDAIDMRIEPGQRLALLGASGSGKSTVLRLIAGFEAPDVGEIRMAGRLASIDGKVCVPPEERNLAVVFQDLGLWPHLTCAQHLEFCLRAIGFARDKRAAQIIATLERAGLADHADRYPGTLSGGEQQRLAIARALVVPGRSVLLDEPFTNLDVVLKRDLLSLLRTTLVRDGAAVLFVTHDFAEASALADTIAILEGGRISQIGSSRELREQPASDFIRCLTAESNLKE